MWALRLYDALLLWRAACHAANYDINIKNTNIKNHKHEYCVALVTADEPEEGQDSDDDVPLQLSDLGLVVGVLGMDPRIQPVIANHAGSGEGGDDGAQALVAVPVVPVATEQQGSASNTAGGAASAAKASDDARAVEDLLLRAKDLVRADAAAYGTLSAGLCIFACSHTSQGRDYIVALYLLLGLKRHYELVCLPPIQLFILYLSPRPMNVCLRTVAGNGVMFIILHAGECGQGCSRTAAGRQRRRGGCRRARQRGCRVQARCSCLQGHGSCRDLQGHGARAACQRCAADHHR